MMTSIEVKGHVGEDGLLILKIPTNYRDTDLEAILVINPIRDPIGVAGSNAGAWPPGFIEATAGSIDDTSFQRWPQGEFEGRNPL